MVEPQVGTNRAERENADRNILELYIVVLVGGLEGWNHKLGQIVLNAKTQTETY